MLRVTSQSVAALRPTRWRAAPPASLAALIAHGLTLGRTARERLDAALRQPTPPVLTTGAMTLVTVGCIALMVALLFGSSSPKAAPDPALTVPIVAVAVAKPEPPRPIPPPTPAAPRWASDLLARPAERLPLLASTALTHPLPSAGRTAEAQKGSAEPSPALAQPARAIAEEDDFTGVWAVSEKACTPQVGREGFLPTIINAQGAWAGETTCSFKSGRREGKGWTFAAVCSDVSKSWRSDVHLSVDGKRLTWRSQSGARSYVRCDLSQSRADADL